jgi:predicted site-specific integrase-resolvase
MEEQQNVKGSSGGGMPQAFTIKQLSQYFHRSPRTLYRWIHEGVLFPHAYRVKDGWYVPKRDVLKLMKPSKIV